MNVSLGFIRIFFVLMCILFMTTYVVSTSTEGITAANLIIGLAAGAILGLSLIGAEMLFAQFSLRQFNTALLGLLFGYLLGQAVLLIFNAIVSISNLTLSLESLALLRIGIFLFTTYLGMVLTARASEEISVSIPFVKFKPTSYKKKDILVDPSALMDSRIIDLASSGLLDHNLVIPRFTIKELTAQQESNDENLKTKSRRSLDTVKKLENIPSLELRYVETDFPDIKDPMAKLLRLARSLDANILTADLSRIQQAQIEGIRIINIHLLSNALKPITQSGESISIKIQRYGKEPRQGVGYLDDGTMVVVNGGAEYIGDTIKAQVLSVKHTSSGRMIFCNTLECDMLTGSELEQTVADLEHSHKNYFAL